MCCPNLPILCVLLSVQSVLQQKAATLRPYWSVRFLVKFHCEMNPCELIWSFTKKILREKYLNGKVDQLRKSLPVVAELVTPERFQSWTEHCMRYMRGYAEGLPTSAVFEAVRKRSRIKPLASHARGTAAEAVLDTGL